MTQQLFTGKCEICQNYICIPCCEKLYESLFDNGVHRNTLIILNTVNATVTATLMIAQ